MARVTHGGVLFCFDHKPASVFVVSQNVQDVIEIDAALGITRDGEDASTNRLQEARIGTPDMPHNARSDVFRMEMGNAPGVITRERQGIGTAKNRVAGIE